MLLSMIYLFQVCLGYSKTSISFHTIFLVGRTFVLPIFAKKVQLSCLFGVLHVFFDKI